MYTFIYKVEYYFDDEDHRDNGLLYASNFTEAARKLEEYYGEDLTNILYLEPYDVGVFTFDDADAETIKSILDKCF